MSSETMKAARWNAAKDVRVEETEIPTTGSKQVKIEVQFAGICGSDLHEYTHGYVDSCYTLLFKRSLRHNYFGT